MMRLNLNKSPWMGLLLRQRKGSQQGIAAVEFALILPFLLVVILGGMSVAILIYNQAVLANASREAARWQVVVQNYAVTTNTYTTSGNCPTTAPTTVANPIDLACKRARESMLSLSNTSPVTVSVVSTAPATGNRYVTVTVSHPLSGLFQALNFTGQLSPSTTMYYE